MESEFTNLTADEVNSVYAVTTDHGPFEDDLLFEINTGTGIWRIPGAQSNSVLDWLGKFENVDWQSCADAAVCAENKRFLIWERDDTGNISRQSSD